MLSSPNFTDSYFGPGGGGSGNVIGPGSQTNNALVRYDNTLHYIKDSGVLLDDNENITNVKSTSYQSVLVQPTGPNALWVNQADSHLYLDGVDIQATGSGNVVAPVTRAENTIPVWVGAPSLALKDTIITIDEDENIGLNGDNTGTVGSITFNGLPTNPGATATLWLDNDSSHLTFGDNEVAQIIGAPGPELGLFVRDTTQDNGLMTTGFSLPVYEQGDLILVSHNDSNQTDIRPYINSTIIGTNLSNSISFPTLTASNNQLIGHSVGQGLGSSVTNSDSNTLIGNNILIQNDGNHNVCIGENMLNGSALPFSNVITNSVCIGFAAAEKMISSGTVAIGYQAANSLAADNAPDGIFIGNQCGVDMPDGWGNILIGSPAVQSNATTNAFTGNIVMGKYGCGNVTSAQYNILLGDDSSLALTTGSNNIVMGHQTYTSATTGSRNIAIGKTALTELTTGNDNIVIGPNAGSSLTTGQKNIIIGNTRNLPDHLVIGSNNIIINGELPNSSDGSAITVIGNTTTNECYVFGIYGATGNGTTLPVLVDTEGKLCTATGPLMMMAMSAEAKISEPSSSLLDVALADIDELKKEVASLKERLAKLGI